MVRKSIISSCIFGYILVVMTIGCQKPESDDLSGTEDLSGTVLFEDTIRGMNEQIPVPNQIVKISESIPEFRNNFIYSVKSRSNGAFLFTNLSNKEYVVHSETMIDGLGFYAYERINPYNVSSLNLVLRPDTMIKNILFIVARDAQTNGRLFKARVCVHTSALLASANECDGSFVQLVTDSYGRAFLTGVKPGRYFLNTTLTAGSVVLKSKDSIDIPRSTGIHSKNLFLK